MTTDVVRRGRSRRWRGTWRRTVVRTRPGRRRARPPSVQPRPRNDRLAPETDNQMRQLLLTIGSELAVITGLLYYFGWVRTAAQSEALGFSSGVLNLSIADYLLKSVTFLFPILIALLLLLIVGHVTVVRLLRNRPPVGAGARRLARPVKAVAWFCATAGVLGTLPPVESTLSLPIGLTLGVVGAIAARSLEIRAGGEDPWTGVRRWMMTLLLIFLIFWDTERVAQYFGEQFAADYRACPEQFPAIVVHSKDDLALTADGITVEPAGGGFRYTGLRLMESTADRYILIDSAAHTVFVLPHGDSVRVEFAVANGHEYRCGGR
jgi:hypothetical protein